MHSRKLSSKTLDWRDHFAKMQSATALEKKLSPTLHTQWGGMSSTANTNIALKIITLDISQAPLKAALSFSYELQNLENADRYQDIINKAKARKINKSEYIRSILAIEAEAVYFRSQAFRESNTHEQDFPCKVKYLYLFDQTKYLSKEKVILLIALDICESGIARRNYSAKKYYSDQYASFFAKANMDVYETAIIKPPILLGHSKDR